MANAKIKIETTKDNAKDQHDKTQMQLDITMMTIYTDGSDIENKVEATTHNSVINEAINTSRTRPNSTYTQWNLQPYI